MSDRVRRRARNRSQAALRWNATYQRSPKPAPRSRSSKPVTVAVLCLLAGIGAWGLWQSSVKEFEIVNAPSARIETALAAALAERYHFLWQAYTVNANEVIRDIDLPEVDGLRLQPDWQQRTLVVEMEERPPVLQWQSRQRRYAVAASGLVLGEANETAAAELPRVLDQAGLPVEEGSQVVTAKFVAFVLGLDQSGLEARELRIIDTAGELHAQVAAGYDIRFSTGEDLQRQLHNVARVQALAAERGESIVEYIDVRIPYKAYYR